MKESEVVETNLARYFLPHSRAPKDAPTPQNNTGARFGLLCSWTSTSFGLPSITTTTIFSDLLATVLAGMWLHTANLTLIQIQSVHSNVVWTDSNRVMARSAASPS